MVRCIASTRVLISLLLSSVAIFEIAVANEKYIYTFGDTEVKLKKRDVFAEEIQFIDMLSLAEFCGFERTCDGSRAVFSANGTKVTVEDGSDTVAVNSFERKMTAPARFTDTEIYLPLQTVLEFIPTLSATVEEKRTVISTSTDKVYIVALDGFEIEYATDVSAYLEYISTTDQSSLILVNKAVTLGSGYVPIGLVEIPAKYRKDSKIYLNHTAERALEAMMQDAFSIGFTDLFVTSAYRSYEYQKALFDTYVNQEKESGLSYDEAVKKVLTYSAEAGKSEHQSGLCIDFMVRAMQELENYGYEGEYTTDVGFAETEVYEWLRENAWKYGFILRYPEDKVNITGYTYESWHYRFVGLEAAAIIQQTGLCFEEYLNIFNK